jgi:predicted metal-dependent phosphoesterase TrpH
MIDLHTHSTASDGTLEPEQLVYEAHKKGLSALSLTDHDTIDGLAEAGAEAARLDIRFIPGIEIAIQWEPGEFHLLGLGLWNPSAGLLAAVSGLSKIREQRNYEILERMRGIGVDADYKEVSDLSGGHSVGRPHFAALLIKRKVVKNVKQAFDRYLGKGKPLYVPKDGLPFQEAARLIKESGGITVLAHPLSLYVAWGRLPDIIISLQEQGLDGIEAWHPTAKVRACQRLEELGQKLGLFITAGSDFHGSLRPERKLGITAGGKTIEDTFLSAIPALRILPS